jgi:hypothetical protein
LNQFLAVIYRQTYVHISIRVSLNFTYICIFIILLVALNP